MTATLPHVPAAFRERDIRLSVRIKASPERIYKALSSARELCLWWLDRAETDARNLGRFRMVWPTRREGRGVFVDLEPGRKLAWAWDGLERSVPPLTTVFIEPKKRFCLVTLVHAGFPARSSKARVEQFGEFWEDCLAKLALYLESGKTCKSDKLTLAEFDLLRSRSR